jgi:riboflavin transporter FmnP
LSGQATRNIIAAFSFIATALNVALAAYVLYKNPRCRINWIFALVAATLAVTMRRAWPCAT